MDRGAILEGLNGEQRRAVETPRGPVCILAGAGTGKTTTITRRIAYQVACGAFEAHQVLAVTFTDKAATEMRERLRRLGVERVNARTFHSAALAQLRGLAPEPPERVLPSKVLLLRQIGNSLPGAYRFRPASDLATEVEWAKNRRVGPDEYLDSLHGRRPPIPEDLMARVYRQYERRKATMGAVDFEDLLELAIRLFDEDDAALTRFRARYRAFTVDEYQDVNLLQQTLLERWLGERDDLCAVGDDYQSIYGFTGATPGYLLSMPERFQHAAVVRLESSYRSTPQILELANRLVPGLGGSAKRLHATRPDGPEPLLRAFADRGSEVAFVGDSIRALGEGGTRYEETAVLYRLNARSQGYEEELAAAGIPYQVRAGAFLARPAARRLLPLLRGSTSTEVAGTVFRAAEAEGLLPSLPPGLGEAETTRQGDLKTLVRLAADFDDGARTVADFVADLERRLAGDDARGVHLLTYHRAKGLEFEAVFLPRLEENELPVRQAGWSDAALAEERRLLYVGMTRAKRHLTITWAGKPSRFLRELGANPVGERKTAKPDESELPPAFGALKDWRRKRAAADGVPAYVVFHDSTLAEIALRNPTTAVELAGVAGVGPAKLERYAEDVLSTLARTS